MTNLFDTITKGLPKATEAQLKELQSSEPVQAKDAPDKLSTAALVQRWQKTGDSNDTAELLRRMKSTMNSAITSYAPGMENELSIKAAKLTLDALKNYRPDLGADPSTYVFHNLKRLNRVSGERSNIIPVSEAASLEINQLRRLSSDIEAETGREPTIEELADASGFNTRKVMKLLNRNTIVNDSSTLSEESQQSTFATKDLTDMDYFEYVYSSVSPIDKKIMEWTAGAHDKPELSNNAIAAKLHISPAAVSQRKAKLQQMLSEIRGLL